MYLLTRTDKHGQCFPTQRQIASDIGCKTDFVKKWNEQLCDAGYLTYEKEPGRRNFTYTVRTGDRHSFNYLPDWHKLKSGLVTPVKPESIIVPQKGDSIVPQKGDSTFSMQPSPLGKGKGTFSRKRKRLLSLNKRKLISFEGKVIKEIPFDVPRNYEQFCLDVDEFIPTEFFEAAESFYFEKEHNGWMAGGQRIKFWRKCLVGYIATVMPGHYERDEIAAIE